MTFHVLFLEYIRGFIREYILFSNIFKRRNKMRKKGDYRGLIEIGSKGKRKKGEERGR